MDALARAGLLEDALVAVDTPEIVARYNACLLELGIEPTGLARFRIDGIGWSPEIAAEKENDQYLSAGIANPMGVLVSPSQGGKPVCRPYNSYDRRLVDAYFDRFHHSIADITATTFIGLDIDAELTEYHHPRDLLLVHYIVVRSVAGGLFDAVREQRALVERFMSDGLHWLDPRLRKALRDSAAAWGDLRYRRADVPELKFDLQSFHTEALGGVFVLRCVEGATLLVVEDARLLRPRRKAAFDEYATEDAELPERLLRSGVMQVDLAWYADHPEVLADKKAGLLADVVCEQHPELNYAELKLAQRRQLGARLADRLPPVYHQLERLSVQLERGKRPDEEALSPALRMLLMRPDPELPESEQEVLWLLLCRLQPVDVVRLWRSDKSQFFAQYRTWTRSKQEWALDLVATRREGSTS
jgi:hypothetical protein